MKESNKSKQVIVIRNDLRMPIGKIASQVAHASLGAILNMKNKEKTTESEVVLSIRNQYQKDWLDSSFTKICLRVNSEKELIEIYNKCIEMGLNSSLILDEGRTVFEGIETYTCVGIGPDDPDVIDKVTGHLSLF